MKVIKFLFFVVIVSFSLCFKNMDKPFAISKSEIKVLDYNYLKNEMIRFHVIANSDSIFDQMIKNKIKDEILKYLNENKDLNSTKFDNMNTLYKSINHIEEICYNILNSFNINQDITIGIEKKYFEDRIYDGYLVPEGIYDSFVIYIGNGLGKNFWSMIFSNIGFIHNYDESKKINSMMDIISDNKNKKIEVFNNNDKANNSNSNFKISFKIVDIIANLFQKIF